MRAEVNIDITAKARDVCLSGVEDHGMRDTVIAWQPGRPCHLFWASAPRVCPTTDTKENGKWVTGSRIVSYD